MKLTKKELERMKKQEFKRTFGRELKIHIDYFVDDGNVRLDREEMLRVFENILNEIEDDL